MPGEKDNRCKILATQSAFDLTNCSIEAVSPSLGSYGPELIGESNQFARLIENQFCATGNPECTPPPDTLATDYDAKDATYIVRINNKVAYPGGKSTKVTFKLIGLFGADTGANTFRIICRTTDVCNSEMEVKKVNYATYVVEDSFFLDKWVKAAPRKNDTFFEFYVTGLIKAQSNPTSYQGFEIVSAHFTVHLQGCLVLTTLLISILAL